RAPFDAFAPARGPRARQWRPEGPHSQAPRAGARTTRLPRTMLWLALELPALPLQLAERAGVSARPLVIAEGPAQRPVVASANAAAKAAGIREGQAVAAARALAGELRVIDRDP